MQKRIASLLCLCSVLFWSGLLFAADDFPTKPTLHNGKKWRIAYIEGGAFKDYRESLASTIEGLMDLEWIEKKTVPRDNATESGKLWKWLSTEIKSNYLEFVPDAYWSANYNKEKRVENKAALLTRVNEQKDIDLIIAMGTSAGLDIANNDHHTPTIIASVADPVVSKIIKSSNDSGFDHVTARVDPDRYERQINVFYEIIGFKRLGVVFEDTPEGKAIAALESVKKIAKQKNFTVVTCHAPFSTPELQKSAKDLTPCYEELSKKVDALYITNRASLNPENIQVLLKILEPHKIATFAQMGSDMVKRGVLLSIAAPSRFRAVGVFYAQTIAKIFNGAMPRQLPQEFQGSPRIAINLAAAKKIGFDPAVDILGAADEIYEEILEEPKKDEKK